MPCSHKILSNGHRDKDTEINERETSAYLPNIDINTDQHFTPEGYAFQIPYMIQQAPWH